MGDPKTLVAALRIYARQDPNSLIAEAIQYIDELQKYNAGLVAERNASETKLLEVMSNDVNLALVAYEAVLRVVGEQLNGPKAEYKLNRAQVAVLASQALKKYGKD